MVPSAAHYSVFVSIYQGFFGAHARGPGYGPAWSPEVPNVPNAALCNTPKKQVVKCCKVWYSVNRKE